MKKIYTPGFAISCLAFVLLLSPLNNLRAQCTNADFSNGNFTGGWTGTYSAHECTGVYLLGICAGCGATNPLNAVGFNQGPNNAVPSLASSEWSHVLCTTAGGNDPNLNSMGATLPMVWPGGGSTYSCRQGNMWQNVGSDATGDGETTSYSFVVTPNNCNFTYHYAVVLNDGGHSNGEQPFFNIAMTDGGGNPITCAAYQVDATTAATIGGFNQIAAQSIWWKPWSSVFIPLNNYMGQTVKITFTTRGCLPSGCAGSHYAYAYLSAECAPLALVASSPTVCGGTNLTLTAPQGAATYSWSGPGIVSGANSQIVTIDQPGQYVVQMTTFGDQPCTFSLDTIMTGNPANPIASFTAPTVCSGSPTTFTDQSTPHASLSAWSWNFGDGGTSNQENPTHTFATTGTFAVTLTVTSTPCTKDTIINVTVSPPPTSTFTATSPVCEGTNSSIVYTGNGLAGDTYTWNFNGGTATPGTGQGPQTVSWTTAGTKNITLTVSAGSCSSTPSTQQVVVDPFPGMTITPYTPICAGTSATLTATGATTYTWAADPTLSATNTGTVTATPASTTTYTVTGTSTNCTAVDTVTVGVFPIPTSTFTATSPVCVGQNSAVTYTGNAGAGATYTWNFGGGNATPASGQGPFQVNWNAAGTPNITLTVSQYGCTSPLTTVPITVNPNPTSTFTTTSPLCLGQNSTVTFTGTATGAAVYTWGFNGGTVISGANEGPYSINWASAGTFNVTLSITDNGCTSPLTTHTVTINPIPTATFTAVSPVCALQNSTVTYTGTASVNATYAWNFSGGTSTPATQVQGPYQVNWATAGTYNITLNVTENGCVAPPVTVPVTVNPTPTSTFTATGPVCTGDPSTVTYTGTGDNLATYTWGFSGGVAVPGTGQGPHTVTWATAGTQNVTLVVSENGCTSPPTTVPVVVNAIPTATFTASTPLCVGQNGTITYTGSSDNAAQFTWGFSGANIVSGGGVNSPGPFTVNWSAASVGVQNITLAVTDNGCVATPVTVPVTINAIPVSDAGVPVVYCSGGSGVIGGASTAGYSYLWTPSAGLSDATSANPTVTLTTAPDNITTQNYTVTTTSQGCNSTASVLVTVNPVPAPVLTVPPPQCLTGNNFTFKTQGTFLNSATFAWTFGADATPATSTATTQNVTYSTPGTRAVSYTVTQSGCSTSLTDSVTVYSMPQPFFGPDTVKGCENFEVCFTNTSSGVGPLAYTWNFGDGESSGDQNPCHLYVSPGIYSVYLKVVSSQQCSYDTTVLNLIQVIADPIAKFTPSALVVQQPQSLISFTNQSLNSVSYLWNFNSAGVSDASIGNSTDINPQFNFTQYGLYTVTLTAYNELRCADSTQLPITVLPPQNFFIPNAFTPNGDGNNDEFFIFLQEGATLMSFKVFDRWGEKVHDGLYAWDGSIKGKKAPEGVYVYEANIHLIDLHLDILRKGSVTLIR